VLPACCSDSRSRRVACAQLSLDSPLRCGPRCGSSCSCAARARCDCALTGCRMRCSLPPHDSTRPSCAGSIANSGHRRGERYQRQSWPTGSPMMAMVAYFAHALTALTRCPWWSASLLGCRRRAQTEAPQNIRPATVTGRRHTPMRSFVYVLVTVGIAFDSQRRHRVWLPSSYSSACSGRWAVRDPTQCRPGPSSRETRTD
jgi:hypothetical protein